MLPIEAPSPKILFPLTLRFVDQHEAAQQWGQGDGQEGGVCVCAPSQQLRQEGQDGRKSRRRGVAFELQEVVSVTQEEGHRVREGRNIRVEDTCQLISQSLSLSSALSFNCGITGPAES